MSVHPDEEFYDLSVVIIHCMMKHMSKCVCLFLLYRDDKQK